MAEENQESGVPACPRCGQAMHPAMVKTAIWRADRLHVVEDIPSQVCEPCAEQFYDDDVTDALRLLLEDESTVPQRELQVPVYSLEGRIRRRAAAAEGTGAEGAYGDY